MTRIIVIGGGYAGLAAAHRLSRMLSGATITLVNPTDHFQQRIRFHQLACGQPVERLDLAERLRRVGAGFLRGTVVSLDADRRAITVDTDEGIETLEYDFALCAWGSGEDDSVVPGAAAHAHAVSSLDSARRLRDTLRRRGDRVVTVVGGGLTGIEAATEIAESFPGCRVRLMTTGQPGDWLSPGAQRHLRRALDRLGVEVVARTSVSRIEADHLVTDDAGVFDTDVTVWSAGMRARPIATAAGVDVDSLDRVRVDRDMRSVSHQGLYAVGDAAVAVSPHGSEVRMACAAAIPMAWRATEAIVAELSGRALPRWRFRFLYQAISLGRKDGIIQYVRPDDTPVRAYLSGRVAAGYKELVTKSVMIVKRHPGPFRPRRRIVAPRPADAGVPVSG